MFKKNKTISAVLLILIFVFCVMFALFKNASAAQTISNEDAKAKIEKLEKELEGLKSRLKTNPSPAPYTAEEAQGGKNTIYSDKEVTITEEEALKEKEEETNEENYREYSEDLIKVGEELTIEKDEEVNGDAVFVGCNVRLLGKINGSIVSVFSNIEMGPTSRVDGDAVFVLGKIDKDKTAKISGSVVNVLSSSPHFNVPNIPGWKVEKFAPHGAGGPFRALLYVALILIVALIAPKKVEKVSEKLEQELGNSLLFGLLGLVCIIPLALLLVISIIGIPFIIVEAFLVMAFALLGYAGACLILGRRLVLSTKYAGKTSLLVQTLIGALLIGIVLYIPVIGFLVKITIIIFGFGAALMVFFSRKKAQAPAPAAVSNDTKEEK